MPEVFTKWAFLDTLIRVFPIRLGSTLGILYHCWVMTWGQLIFLSPKFRCVSRLAGLAQSMGGYQGYYTMGGYQGYCQWMA